MLIFDMQPSKFSSHFSSFTFRCMVRSRYSRFFWYMIDFFAKFLKSQVKQYRVIMMIKPCNNLGCNMIFFFVLFFFNLHWKNLCIYTNGVQLFFVCSVASQSSINNIDLIRNEFYQVTHIWHDVGVTIRSNLPRYAHSKQNVMYRNSVMCGE